MSEAKHSLQIQREEHDNNLLAKRVSMVSTATIYAVTNTVISLATADIQIGSVEIKDGTSDTRASVTPRNNLSIEVGALSYYRQSSLVSGYTWHGLAEAGTAADSANFRILRETLDTGEVLFGSGTPTFIHTWSAASLASISYS